MGVKGFCHPLHNVPLPFFLWRFLGDALEKHQCSCFGCLLATEWMWALVKRTTDPSRSFEGAIDIGLTANSPENKEPLIRVIRTSKVSPANDRVRVKTVSLTKSPVLSPRISA